MTSHPVAAPKRFTAFATFFKRYMSVSAIVVAALPIPITSLGFVPTYAAHAKALSVYTSLLCFLALALIFYYRHQLAHVFFSTDVSPTGKRRGLSPAVLPALLALICACSLFGYQLLLTHTVVMVRHAKFESAGLRATQDLLARPGFDSMRRDFLESLPVVELRHLAAMGGPDRRTSGEILAATDLTGIPQSGLLTALYLAMFLSAEGAFILMALKEYLQDLLGITDQQLLQTIDFAGKSMAQPPEGASAP